MMENTLLRSSTSLAMNLTGFIISGYPMVGWPLGGVKGWVMFDPALIKEDTSQPIVALTDLKINNKPVVQYGSHATLAAPVNELAELLLLYDQN